MLIMQLEDIIYNKSKYVLWMFSDLLTVECISSISSFPWPWDNKMKIMLVKKIPCCTKQNFFTFQKYTKRYYIFSDQMKNCLNKFLRYEWEIVFVALGHFSLTYHEYPWNSWVIASESCAIEKYLITDHVLTFKILFSLFVIHLLWKL